MGVDFNPEKNLHVLARYAAELGERIREEDPREMFDHLRDFTLRHPVKAAQLLMVFAAWFDPDATTETLNLRAENITRTRIDTLLGRTA